MTRSILSLMADTRLFVIMSSSQVLAYRVVVTQIGLQFPDELLRYSVEVFRAIQSRVTRVGAQCYVLADSTYGR